MSTGTGRHSKLSWRGSPGKGPETLALCELQFRVGQPEPRDEPRDGVRLSLSNGSTAFHSSRSWSRSGRSASQSSLRSTENGCILSEVEKPEDFLRVSPSGGSGFEPAEVPTHEAGAWLRDARSHSSAGRGELRSPTDSDSQPKYGYSSFSQRLLASSASLIHGGKSRRAGRILILFYYVAGPASRPTVTLSAEVFWAHSRRSRRRVRGGSATSGGLSGQGWRRRAYRSTTSSN